MNFKSIIRHELPEIITGIILMGFIWGTGYLISHHRNAIEKRYGFCTMTPDMKWIPCHIEPIMIRCIKQDGSFDKAGFKDRDILILPGVHTVAGFHKLLDKPRGTLIEFNVIPFDKFKPDCDTENWGETEKRLVITP
jgi:hypothetical protein